MKRQVSTVLGFRISQSTAEILDRLQTASERRYGVEWSKRALVEHAIRLLATYYEKELEDDPGNAGQIAGACRGSQPEDPAD